MSDINSELVESLVDGIYKIIFSGGDSIAVAKMLNESDATDDEKLAARNTVALLWQHISRKLVDEGLAEAQIRELPRKSILDFTYDEFYQQYVAGLAFYAVLEELANWHSWRDKPFSYFLKTASPKQIARFAEVFHHAGIFDLDEAWLPKQ